MLSYKLVSNIILGQVSQVSQVVKSFTLLDTEAILMATTLVRIAKGETSSSLGILNISSLSYVSRCPVFNISSIAYFINHDNELQKQPLLVHTIGHSISYPVGQAI